MWVSLDNTVRRSCLHSSSSSRSSKRTFNGNRLSPTTISVNSENGSNFARDENVRSEDDRTVGNSKLGHGHLPPRNYNHSLVHDDRASSDHEFIASSGIPRLATSACMGESCPDLLHSADKETSETSGIPGSTMVTPASTAATITPRWISLACGGGQAIRGTPIKANGRRHRHDFQGRLIQRGSKLHSIAFIDEVDVDACLVRVHEIEPYQPSDCADGDGSNACRSRKCCPPNCIIM